MTYKSGIIQCELLASDMRFLSDVIYQLTIQRIENSSPNNNGELEYYSYLEGFFDGVVSTQKSKKDKIIKISLSNIRVYQLCDILKVFLQQGLLINIDGIKNEEEAQEKAGKIRNDLSSKYADFLA